ncbi:MAG: hypothetical protein HP492_02190, partial [Nitrospira sp.]|nr:hypothetical protein [Nitrospira sp.]
MPSHRYAAPVARPSFASQSPLSPPLRRYSVRLGDFDTLASLMEQATPYQRNHYRLPLPVSYPVMFSDTATIGEGLVTQIPALITSTAAGIIVTRAASESNLGTDMVAQLFA